MLISWTWGYTTFHNFLWMWKKNQKLAGLWLAGEVVNHVGTYGSKAAEGFSAFQRQSCSLCSHHCIIMKFLGVITIDRSDVHANGRYQRSKVKILEFKTQLEFANGYEMMHKAWSSITEVLNFFQGHLSNFKVTHEKNHWFWPELSVLDCNYKSIWISNGYSLIPLKFHRIVFNWVLLIV